MRKVWSAIVVLFCIGLVLAAFAQTQQSSPPQQTFVLRYKGKPGDVNRYKSWFVMRMVGTFVTPAGPRERKMEYQSEATYLHKIVSVAEDETLEIETTKESGKAKIGDGERMEDLPDRPYKRVVKMTNRGKVLESKEYEDGEVREEDEEAEESTVMSRRYDPTRWLDKIYETAVHNVAFPEQPIKVGDVWQEKVSEQMTPNCKVPITINSRFKELVKLEGRLCAVIQSDIDAPFEAQDSVGDVTVAVKGRFTATLTIYFDPELGDEVQATDEGRLVLEMTLSAPGRPSLTITNKVISRGKTVKLD
ncbi:MAG: hypothetical protein N3B10_04785 [Armatimonadetes bacterium]|nr:hypothetical protein [Armatimonadota bacterium]